MQKPVLEVCENHDVLIGRFAFSWIEKHAWYKNNIFWLKILCLTIKALPLVFFASFERSPSCRLPSRMMFQSKMGNNFFSRTLMILFHSCNFLKLTTSKSDTTTTRTTTFPPSRVPKRPIQTPRIRRQVLQHHKGTPQKVLFGKKKWWNLQFVVQDHQNLICYLTTWHIKYVDSYSMPLIIQAGEQSPNQLQFRWSL